MKFHWLLLLLAGVLYGGGFLIPPFVAFAGTWVWPLLVAGYGLLTWALHRWLLRASKGTPNAFVTAVNGSTAAKMMLSMVLVLVYLLAGGAHRVPFALGLFVAFAVNTAALVVSAQRLVRSKPNN